MANTIEIRELKAISLRGGVLIDAIRSPTGRSFAVGDYLIDQLGLDLVGIVDSDDFPPISTVIDSRPNFPMRIYASFESKVAVIVSDFAPSEAIIRPLARSMLAWTRRQSVGLIITTFWSGPRETSKDIRAACSTENARARLEQSRMNEPDRAILVGLPGVLLNEASWNNMDVIALLTSSDDLMEAAATEKVIEAIDVLLPEVKFRSEIPPSERGEKLALPTSQDGRFSSSNADGTAP